MVRLCLFSWPSLRAPSNCLGRHRHPHPHRLCPWRLLFLQPRKWMNPTSFVDLIGAPKAPTMAPLGGQPYGLRPRSEVGGTCGETVDIIHNLWSSNMVVDILISITEGRPYHGNFLLPGAFLVGLTRRNSSTNSTASSYSNDSIRIPSAKGSLSAYPSGIQFWRTMRWASFPLKNGAQVCLEPQASKFGRNFDM